MTKVFSEIRILNNEFGGDLDTVFLSCGLGDVSMTSLNDLSRNRTLGLLIGKGFYNPNSNDNTVIVEGVNSINIIFDLMDATLIKKLPLLSRLHKFFNSSSKKFSINFKELFVYK
jgi:glycerol-3-phosphate dehydrogenase (NAD(P)+)